MSRRREYIEDSTKGKSMINPRTFKGDVLVQVWMDSRVLATLMKWMDEKGDYPRHMSEVVRRPLETLAEHLVGEGEVQMVEDTGIARMRLETRLGVKLNRGGRGEKNMIHNLALSGKIGEKRTSMGDRAVEAYAEVSKGHKYSGLFDNLDMGQELVREKEREESKVRVRMNADVVDSVVVKERMTDKELEDKARELKVREEAERKAHDEWLESLKKDR